MAEASTLAFGATGALGRHVLDTLLARDSTEGYDNATYSLSGDTDFTYADIAEAMSVVLKREVTYQPVTPEQAGRLPALPRH